MFLFVLSKENPALSQAEAERLHGVTGKRSGNLLFLDSNEWKPGLAFTRGIYEVLFEAPRDALDARAASFPWHVEPPFAIRGNGLVEEQVFAGYVWRSLEQAGTVPAVDLQHPTTLLTLFAVEKDVWVARKAWENEERFFDRRAHLRPRNHPTSLNPKLARAMINLAGPPEEVASILDPFCGSGGLLLEGALAGRAMTGIDLDPVQIARAEENLAFYSVGANLAVGDATTCDRLGRSDAIVTDLPLGKNAKLADATGTFTAFFVAAARTTERMVVASDASFPLASCFQPVWREEAQFDWPIHAGMVKRLRVLSRAGP